MSETVQEDNDWKFGIALIIFLVLLSFNFYIAIIGPIAWFLYLYNKKQL